jgi:hypothetical protein
MVLLLIYKKNVIQYKKMKKNKMKIIRLKRNNANQFERYPARGEGDSMQQYVIKFVSDLQQVGGFLPFPPPVNLTATI